MFRASDIFGRKPGIAPDRPTVPVKVEAGHGQKRPEPGSSGPKSRMWDPATGKFVEEELPAEVAELLGIKRPRALAQSEAPELQAWGAPEVKRTARVLSPATVGLAPQVKPLMTGEVDKTAPSVEYRGFSKVELNDRYFERPSIVVNGRPTYWTTDVQYFLYWQGEVVQRWSICDSASFPAVKAGQLPGWAYKDDHRHLCEASGWMEAWNGQWRDPELEVVFRTSSNHKAHWEDPIVQRSITTVEFHGFTMKELNTRFHLRANEVLQDHPSYWDASGVYFIYWQAARRRWAICDLKCIDAVKSGECPGWAYRSNAGHFANACGWMEMRANVWAEATLETAVIGASAKGLRVEFNGFSKKDLNTQYVEKADEEIQGRVSFWDPSGTYFIYWQRSMRRWAVCDKLSLQPAKAGLAPGWAYRTDSQHFAKSSGWMEVYGRDWRPATAICTVLEGTVRDDSALVKDEVAGASGTLLSVEQYRLLVRAVYEEHNTSKLAAVDSLFEKFQGREQELFSQVCEKYQVDPESLADRLPELGQEAQPHEEGEGEGDEQYEHLENAEVPQLSAGEYAVLIQSVYEQYNPKKAPGSGEAPPKVQETGTGALPRGLQQVRHAPREVPCQDGEGAAAACGAGQPRVSSSASGRRSQCGLRARPPTWRCRTVGDGEARLGLHEGEGGGGSPPPPARGARREPTPLSPPFSGVQAGLSLALGGAGGAAPAEKGAI